jgi:tetratricopeptide (TPR) repeat protein
MLRFATILAVLAFAGRSDGQESQTTQSLKELAVMPRTGDITFSIGFNTVNGFFIEGEDIDHSAEIRAIEGSLRGNLDDAEKYGRLSVLYATDEKSKAAGERTVELAKRRLAENPNDPAFIWKLGRAHFHSGEFLEAEPHLRKAVELLPRENEAWIDLGNCLFSISSRQLVNGNKSISIFSDRFVKFLSEHPISAERLAEINQRRDESAACLDRAVELAPESPNPYWHRATIRALRRLQDSYLQQASGARPNSRLELQRYLDQDWQTAAKLAPENPLAIGQATLWMFMAYVLGSDDPQATFHSMKFNAEDQKLVDERNGQLERLMSHRDRKISADARYVRAVLLFLLEKDSSRSSKLVRESLKERRTHFPSMELLFACLADGKEWAEALSLSEERLRIADKPSLRYNAAVSAFHLGKLDVAERHLRQGLRLDPKDLDCNLGLTAVLLNRFDKSNVDEIRQCLFEAEIQCPEGDSSVRRSETVVLRSVAAALMGDLPFARRTIQKLLENEPNNQPAKNLAKVLGK